MLARSQRVSARLFKEIMQTGRSTHTSLFVLRHIRTGLSAARIGASVPVKVAKKAVVRNTMRRRMYGAVETFYGDIPQGVEAILFAKAPSLHTSPSVLRAEARSIFEKAGILK